MAKPTELLKPNKDIPQFDYWSKKKNQRRLTNYDA